MPNNKQTKKRMVQDERRHSANKSLRSAMKTAVKKVLKAESAEDARAALPNAMKRIDKAAKAKVIHENAAARKKGRLARVVSAK